MTISLHEDVAPAVLVLGEHLLHGFDLGPQLTASHTVQPGGEH
jgi:hypothetical protein